MKTHVARKVAIFIKMVGKVRPNVAEVEGVIIAKNKNVSGHF